jgi:magnesium transporter
MPSITTRSYRETGAPVVADGLDTAAALLAEEGTVVWVDVDEPSEATLAALASQLHLHPLAVEDALQSHQRDKYVHYDAHVLLVAHAAQLDVDAAELRLTELDVFVGERWLVTVRRGGDEWLSRALARWDQVRPYTGCHLGIAVHALLTVVLDSYVQTIDRFEAFYEDVADRIFTDEPTDPAAQRRWFEMRRALNRFDRVVRPLSEALRTVVDQDLDRLPTEVATYLRDVAGELAGVAAEVASLRELADHLVDSDLVLRDYRQNVVMKKVTSWAAIIAVPTLVTGYYGMNVPFPGEHEVWGVVASSGLAVAGGGALYAVFRRRGWL